MQKTVKNAANKTTLKSIAALFVVSFIIATFNNCSPSKHDEGSESAGSLSTSLKSCDSADQFTLFNTTYHPFTKSRCAKCHFGGGLGPGAFASPSPETAYESFTTIGASTINRRALDGHSSGSGTQNTAALNDVMKKWDEGIAFLRSCQLIDDAELLQEQDSPDRVHLRSKRIGFNNTGDKPYEQTTVLTWDLSKDTDVIENKLNSPDNAAERFKRADFANAITNCDDGDAQNTNCNVQFKVNVGIYFTGSKLAYIISRPRLEAYGQSIRMDSVLFLLNGKAEPAQRAFYFTKRDIRGWNSQHPFQQDNVNYDLLTRPPTGADLTIYNRRRSDNFLIANSTLIIDGSVQTTDVLSVSFGKLHKINMPPLEALPTLSLEASGRGTVAGNVVNATWNAVTQTLKLPSEDAIPDPDNCTPQPECARSPGDYSSYEVKLKLDKASPFSEISSVDLEFDSTQDVEVMQECCTSTVNFENDDILHDIFNRDFEQLNDSGVRARPFKVFDLNERNDSRVRWHVTFLPGETEKILYFRVVPDDRYEVSSTLDGQSGEMVKIKVRGVSLLKLAKDAGGNVIKNTANIFIPDNDVAPINDFTYTELMSGTGVLRAECVRCHNSIDNRGGYDMTNYWQMVQEGILVRGGGTRSFDSLMYQRMNPGSNTSTVGLPSMPPGSNGGNNFLPAITREAVVYWLQDHKANND